MIEPLRNGPAEDARLRPGSPYSAWPPELYPPDPASDSAPPDPYGPVPDFYPPGEHDPRTSNADPNRYDPANGVYANYPGAGPAATGSSRFPYVVEPRNAGANSAAANRAGSNGAGSNEAGSNEADPYRTEKFGPEAYPAAPYRVNPQGTDPRGTRLRRTGQFTNPRGIAAGGTNPRGITNAVTTNAVTDPYRAGEAGAPWVAAPGPPRRLTGSMSIPRPVAERRPLAEPPSSPSRRSSLRPGRLRRDKETQTPAQAAFSAVTEVIVVLAMALGLSLLIKTFLVQAFFIPSQSMENTLLIGDRVLVSKMTPGTFSLQRGDVVVFKDPGGWLPVIARPDDGPVRGGIRGALTFVGLLPQDSGEHLIKRVIGLPGDTVVCCDVKGRLQVNGVSVDESYIHPGNVPSQEKFTVTVQRSHLWVMGDNRSQSADSRFHRELNDGQVPVSDVVGKAFVVVWPLSRAGGVVEPPEVFARVPQPTPR